MLLQPCPVLIPAQRCSQWAEGSHRPGRAGQLLFSAAFRAGCARTVLVQGWQASVLTAPGVPLHGASAAWCVGIHVGIRKTKGKPWLPFFPLGRTRAAPMGPGTLKSVIAFMKAVTERLIGEHPLLWGWLVTGHWLSFAMRLY